MVTVVLLGQTLRQSVDEPEFQLELPAPMSVKGLLEANRERLSGILPFAAKGELLVTVNRKVATLDSAVRDGDTIKLTHQFNPSYEGPTWQNP
jgi:molybdopterin synthase sulfur carrier subunit